MPRRLFDSEYLFGLHDPGGEQIMLDAGKPGWIVFTESIGRNPNDFSGQDYSAWSNRNLGILCRLNHGYSPDGTIPNSTYYEDFAKRCANFVANSRGCKIWIIGNEMNYVIERPPLAVRSAVVAPAVAPSTPERSLVRTAVAPLATLVQSLLRSLSGGMGDAALYAPQGAVQPAPGTDATSQDPYQHGNSERFSALHAAEPRAAARSAESATEPITPELYARCYRLCRDAIHRVPGHNDDLVLIGAVAPWNNQTTYAGNPNGDWVQYFQDILRTLGASGCDGITLHTYTHGTDPNLIGAENRMNPPFQNRYYHFRSYRDFMNAVPTDMRSLPVYITETDEDDPWQDANNGWVKRAYSEINVWNQQTNAQQIRALVLYRWPPYDRWVIASKPGVIADFREALANNYRWREVQAPAGAFKAGDQLETLDIVNLRRTVGYNGKPSTDVLAQIPAATRITVLNGTSQNVDGLTWWNVRYARSGQAALDGWLAQTSPTGATLLRVVQTGATPTPPPPTGKFTVGATVRTAAAVNVRRTAGYTNKPTNDVLAGLTADTTLKITGGPSAADALTWWRVSGTAPTGTAFEGWVAETDPTGQTLLVAATTPPPATGKFRMGDVVVPLTIVRLRRSAGYNNKPANDLLADIAQGTRSTITGGPTPADGLTWWSVTTTTATGTPISGWMAETAPNGVVLLEKATATPPPPPTQQGSFAIGELVVTTDQVRVRRTPGVNNKPDSDTLGYFEPRATVNILEGPRSVDGLAWWRVGGVMAGGSEATGWVAEKSPTGGTLVAKPTKLPGTNIPDRTSGTYLGAPFQGSFGIAQLWGENPQIYSSITYDGVPLKGHNGIDFLTPNGTMAVAVEAGTVAQAVTNDPTGFGNYVKLSHSWGESIYAHLESFSVSVGQRVTRGQVIGRTDNTGMSSGPHLHFAIRINPYNRQDGWGGFSDPLPYLNPRDIQLPAAIATADAAPRAAAVARDIDAWRQGLERAPGYAPDRPGMVRP